MEKVELNGGKNLVKFFLSKGYEIEVQNRKPFVKGISFERFNTLLAEYNRVNDKLRAIYKKLAS